MSAIILRHLTQEDREKFFEASSAEWGDFPFVHYWGSLANKDFDKYIKIVPEFSEGLHIPKGHYKRGSEATCF